MSQEYVAYNAVIIHEETRRGTKENLRVSAFAERSLCAFVDNFMPQVDWLIDAIHERILPLSEHQVTTVQTPGETLRRNRLGV